MNNKFVALKDDDSGDHDQNEENSTQTDGEKEKMERDKGQSSSKRKAVVPGPAEHPLQHHYTFWYSRRTPGPPTSSQNTNRKNIKQIGTFASAEQFCRLYSHMVRPGDLTGHRDSHLFKEGIKPMWEDDANKTGGKWFMRLRKGLASSCWENLIGAMLGEQFMVGVEPCGAVVSVRFQEDIISIRNKTASDQATTARIWDTLQRMLNPPPHTIREYKTHTDGTGPRKAPFSKPLEATAECAMTLSRSLKRASAESLVLSACYLGDSSVVDKRNWKSILWFKNRLTYSSYGNS